jgi:hypothetical protein
VPVVKLRDRLLYFSHVPKAAGSSVERYMVERGALLALRDTRWGKQPRRRRWTATSPQHVDAAQFGRLFPQGFFDRVFTVVRHPEDRILSEYRFRAERGLRDARAPLSEWLRFAFALAARDPYAMDGHVRPQVDFLCGEACAAFRLEDGLDDFVGWLEDALGEPRSGAAFGVRRNATAATPLRLHREDRALIEAFYAADYARFGYDRRPLDPLPTLTAVRRPGAAAAALAGRLAGFLARGG